MSDVVGYIVVAFVLIQGIVMMTSGKVFFLGSDRYEEGSLETFAKKSGFSVIIMSIGLLIFHYGIIQDDPIIWMIVGGAAVAIIGIIVYSIFRKKYLRKR